MQGITRPYYTYNFFKNIQNYEVIPINDIIVYKFFKSFLFKQRINFLEFIKSFFKTLRSLTKLNRVSLIYSYNGQFIITFFGKFILKKNLIYDFDIPPVEQDFEFLLIENNSINWIRRMIFKIQKILYKKILPKADLIIAISQNLKELLIKEYHVSKKKVYVFPLGIDLKRFDPTKHKKEASFAKKNSLICISSITKARVKAFEVVIDGLKILRNNNYIINLVIYGFIPNDIKEFLKNYAKEKEVDDLIEFKGYIPHEKIPEILSEYIYAISPIPDLISYRLACPAKIFEYLAMEKIVIATNISCNTQFLKHNFNGIIYQHDNPYDLADKLKNVLLNSKLRNFIKKNSRNSIKKYNWDYLFTNLDSKLKNYILK